MTGRMERLVRNEGVGEISKKVESGSVDGALFDEYIKSLPAAEQTRVRNMSLSKHARDGLSKVENVDLQTHFREFRDRMQRAENLMANLKDEGVQRLGEALTKSMVIVKPEELPIYIKGLAARSIKSSKDRLMAAS
mgnify:CR=1 FL=1